MVNASLQTTLAPILLFLNAKSTQEIMINAPNEIWVDDGKKIVKHSIDMSFKMQKRLAELIAAQTRQELSEEKPLLSGILPGGHRIQIVMPPVAQLCSRENGWQDAIGMSIRKHTWVDCDLQMFSQQGGFSSIIDKSCTELGDLHQLYQDKKYLELLVRAVKSKKTILISGGTYSGKTTLLNMLLKEVDPHDRMITIEDTPELRITQENQLRLFYSRGMQHIAKVTPDDLLNATLRLRPDRIIMGELRNADGACWLQAANTGHQGTMSTIHSDTPLLAIQKLADMVKMKNPMQSEKSIKQYIYAVLDMVIQVKRDAAAGRRFISDIFIVRKMQE